MPLAHLQNKVVVIKFGGNALTDETAKVFSQSISELIKHKIKPVIVHGGGPQINELLTQINIESTFINGLRYTDRQTIKVAEMVLSGSVNKMLVQQLNQSANELSVQAIGISGKDGQLLEAERITKDDNNQPLDLGFVGKIKTVNTALLHTLLAANYIPVISPIAYSKKGETLNINADYAAAAIAKYIPAHTFIMMTNISGLLDGDKNIIHKATPKIILDMIDKKIIRDGMIPKTLSAIELLNTVSEVKIIDGRDPKNLISTLAGKSVGTTISHNTNQ